MFGVASVTGCLVLGKDWVSKLRLFWRFTFTHRKQVVGLNQLAGVEGHSFLTVIVVNLTLLI